MARRDHSLDGKITSAAMRVFMDNGYVEASLRKIAEHAGVTVGAIQTRYPSKDALFVSLLQDFIDKLNGIFAVAAAEYEKAARLGTVQAILNAIDFEEHIYFKLLTECYEECTLFLGRSDGSSVEVTLKELMNFKTEQTVAFFAEIYGRAPNADAIRVLRGAQFWFLRQLLEEHLEEERMLACLHSLFNFFNAGWQQLCGSLKENL